MVAKRKMEMHTGIGSTVAGAISTESRDDARRRLRLPPLSAKFLNELFGYDQLRFDDSDER